MTFGQPVLNAALMELYTHAQNDYSEANFLKQKLMTIMLL